jgi:hypothetical protein
MSQFSYTPKADTDRTHRISEIDLQPADLVFRFGPPPEDDGYKSSGCFAFTDEENNVFTVYDYKWTTLYHGKRSEFPSPKEFWTWNVPIQFSIGGRTNCGNVDAFKEWLVTEIAGGEPVDE